MEFRPEKQVEKVGAGRALLVVGKVIGIIEQVGKYKVIANDNQFKIRDACSLF